ncbi:hypothetical protein AB0F11_23135 [Streptomyces sp. NPDC032472]|uniref:hypothetical protein n=1 Tax=Streptomyces sp. NPDC032472 TaxID=3155018 RepID=UPI00340C448E
MEPRFRFPYSRRHGSRNPGGPAGQHPCHLHRRQRATGGLPTWSSYVAKDEQYTEYYDLVNDPYQTGKLHQATQAEEQALGIPALAARLAADRAA